MVRDLPSARASVALIAIIVPVLWFGEVQPHRSEAQWPWPGHAQPFSLPSYLPGDCPFYRATLVSLLEDGDLDLRNNVFWGVLSPDTQVAVGLRGEWYPKHPIALALAALPFYVALGDRGLLVFNLVQLAALDLLLLVAARRFASEGVALIVALTFALGTLLRPAANNFSPDVFSTLLVVSGVLLLISARPALAGVLLGAAVGAKWTNLVFLPIAVLWTLFFQGWRPALRLASGAAPFLAALAALNAHMFGSIWVTPYDRVGIHMLEGPQLEASHRTRFALPFWAGLGAQVFDPRNGLLRSAPPLLLSVTGVPLLSRHARAEAALIALFSVAQLAVFARYSDWMASNFGHRFLLTVVALGAAPAAALVAWLLNEPTNKVSIGPRSNTSG